MYPNEEQGFAFALAAQDPGAAPPGWHQFTNQTSLITPEDLTTGRGQQATSPMLHPSSPMLRPSSPLYRYAMSPAMSYVDRLSPAMYGAEPIFVERSFPFQALPVLLHNEFKKIGTISKDRGQWVYGNSHMEIHRVHPMIFHEHTVEEDLGFPKKEKAKVQRIAPPEKKEEESEPPAFEEESEPPAFAKQEKANVQRSAAPRAATQEPSKSVVSVVSVAKTVVEKTPTRKVGLGLLLVKQNFSRRTYVEEIVAGFAAHRSGQFKEGDILVAIDQTQLDGMPLDAVRTLTVGPEGTFCTVQILRGGSYHSVTLQRMVPATVDQSNYDCSLYISDRTVSGLLDQIISHERLDGSMVPQTHIQKDVCREQTIQVMTYESQTDGDISCKKEYTSPHMVGLGLLLINQNFSGQIYVEEIFPGFAAHRSGQFKEGDILVAIDQTQLDGMPLDAVRTLTVGPEGTFCTVQILRGGRYSTVTVQRIMPQTLDESNYNCALQISDRHSSSSRHSGLDSSPRYSDDLGYYRSGSPLRHSGLDSSMVAQTNIQKYARSPVNKHTVPGPTSTYTQPTDKITYGDHNYRYSDDSVALPLWP